MEMLFQYYERGTVSLCKKIIKPGMTVIDVGAHIGYYSILFSKLVGKEGRVFAFEPEPVNLEILKRNVRRFKNIKIIPKAISNKVGVVEFFRSKDKTGCHSLLSADFRRDKIKVESVTLDYFISELQFPKIDLIKMDIEGGEPYAVLGMKILLQSNKDIMLISEFNMENLSLSGVPDKFLENFYHLGFKVFMIKDEGQIEIVRPEGFKKIKELIREREKRFGDSEKSYINIFCKRNNF